MGFRRIFTCDGPPANLLIRLLVGGVVFLGGIKKFLFPEQWDVGRFTHISIPAPGTLAPFVGVVEVVCGFLLLVGLLTRFASIETLMKRIHLRDKRLREISQIVHEADLQDGKFRPPEGKAIQLITKGWAQMNWPDEEILRKGFGLLDALYLTLGGSRRLRSINRGKEFSAA